jgi:hypothetical protein
MKTCKYGCGKMAKGGPVGKVKKMSTGGFAPAQKGGSNTKMGIYGIPNAGGTGPETMKRGGTTTSRAVSPGCRNGMVKDATGKCVMERKFKSGGTTKVAKFAALAAPKDKITYADKIAGAKKKTLVKKQNGGQTVPDKSLFPGSELVGFLGAGLGTALAARRQNSPKVQQKQKERIIAREQKREQKRITRNKK